MSVRRQWLRDVLAGVIGGLAGAAGLALLGKFVGASTSSSGWGDLAGSAAGLIVGTPLGAAFTIWLFYIRQKKGWHIGFSVIAAALLVVLLAEPLRLNVYPALLYSLLVTVPAVVAATVLLWLSQKSQPADV